MEISSTVGAAASGKDMSSQVMQISFSLECTGTCKDRQTINEQLACHLPREGHSSKLNCCPAGHLRLIACSDVLQEKQMQKLLLHLPKLTWNSLAGLCVNLVPSYTRYISCSLKIAQWLSP